MKAYTRDFEISEHFGSWVFLSLLTAFMTPASYFFVDMAYLPESAHLGAAVCRFGLVVLGLAGLAVRYLNPGWIVRHWLGALLGAYVYHVAFLLWFEYVSTDPLRSRYYLGIITITGLTQLFRVQYEVLVLYVVSILAYAYFMWDSSTLGDALFDFATIGIFFFGMAYNFFSYQRKLQTALKQRDDMSALINHGWSFPLQAIADLAQGVKSSVDSSAAGRLELIEAQARILHAESVAIVDSSVDEGQRRPLAGELVPLAPVLELAARSFSVARNGKIEILTPIPKDIKVFGAEQDLFRVFTVLLSNSLSYSPDRRCLISFDAGASSIELEFKNRFAGALRIDDVFEKYVTFSGGTGIGLYDAKRVVEGPLGGEIYCRLSGSDEVKFVMRLPLA